MHKHANWHRFRFWNLLGMCVPLSSFKGIMKSEKELGQVCSFPLPLHHLYCPPVSVNPRLSSSLFLTIQSLTSVLSFLDSFKFLTFIFISLHLISSHNFLFPSVQSSSLYRLFNFPSFLSFSLHHPSISPRLYLSSYFCLYLFCPALPCLISFPFIISPSLHFLLFSPFCLFFFHVSWTWVQKLKFLVHRLGFHVSLCWLSELHIRIIKITCMYLMPLVWFFLSRRVWDGCFFSQ